MLFFFKKKEIVLDCFTSSKAAYEIFKLDYAKKFYPEWWKKLPTTVIPESPKHIKNEVEFKDKIYSTMRTCPGIVDYYKFGFIIPLWSDLIVETGVIGSSYLRVLFADPYSDSNQHTTQQRGEYLPDSLFSHIKLISPWHIECSSPVYFTLMKPIWNFEDPSQFILPPGSLNFKYQHSSNINLFFKHYKENKTHNFNAGQPLVHFIPQTEFKIKIKHHLLSKNEFSSRTEAGFKSFFNNGYFKYAKILKQQNE